LKTAVLSSVFCFSTTFADLPSDVENLIVDSAGEGFVSLSWDGASDSDGIILGYRVYFGRASLDESDYYAEDVYTNSSDPNYKVEGLENGLNYYFAITALDEEENESLNYSNEVSAMPFLRQ